LTQQFDQFRFYEDVEEVLEEIEDFGGVFSRKNLLNSKNTQLLIAVVDRLEQLRNSNTDEILRTVAGEGVRALLSEEDLAEIEALEKQIKETNRQLEIASTAYQKMLVLNKLLPALSMLLEKSDPITDEALLQVYYQIEVLELQVVLVEKFLKKTPKELTEILLSPKEIARINEEIEKYNALEKFASETYKMVASNELSQEALEERLTAYSLLRNDYFLNEFLDLQSEINTVLAKIKSFEHRIINHFESLEKFVAQIAVDAVLEVEEVLTIHTATDYIDVFPRGKTKENSSYWVRIQLSNGVLGLLKEGTPLKNITGALSLVYKPDLTKDVARLDGNTFMPGVTFTQAQRDSLQASLKNIVVDVPLGIQVYNLNLSLGANPNLPLVFQGNDGSVQPLNDIFLALPVDSPWTNFKNNLEVQKKLFNDLQISKQLGLTVEKITVDSKDFDLKFTFRTETGSIIRSLLSLERNANAFEISLREIESTQDILTDNLRTVISQKIARRLNTIIKDERHSEFLETLLIAERIEAAEVVHQEDHITGRIRFVPKGFSALGETFQIDSSTELLFKTDVENGSTSVTMSNIFLPYEAPIRAYVKSFLKVQEEALKNRIAETIQESEWATLLFNIAEDVQFSKFRLDIDRGEISGVMTFTNLSDATMDVVITSGRITINRLGQTLQEIIETKFRELIQSQFMEPLEKSCEDLLQDKNITLYTFDFKVTDVNCDFNQSNLTAKAVYVEAPENFAILKPQTNGQFSIESFEAPILKEKVLDKIRSELSAFSDFKYLEVKDPRFEKGVLVIDAFIKFDVLNMYEKVGKFEIAPDNKNILEASFSDVDIRTAFESKIDDYVEQSLTRFIEKDLLKLEFSKEANGLYITDIEKVSLFHSPKELVFWADAKLKGITVPKFKVTLDLSANNIFDAVKVELPADAVINGLLQNVSKMTNLGGEIVPGLSVTILELHPQIGPIRLEGTIELKINKLTFPAMKFTVTESEIRFYPSLSFPMPGEYPISVSPPLTIFGSSVSLDLDEKQIILGTNVTVGAPGVAEANSKLINLEGSLSAYYSEGNFGSMNLEANLFLITVLQIMEGKGQIDTKKGCFSMLSRTKGPLQDVLKYDNGVAVNCNGELFRSVTKMKVIGVSLENVVTAIKNGGVIGLNGEGYFNFVDVGKMRVKLGTTLEIGDINSVMRNAYANLEGRIEVGDFNIARAEVETNYKRALLSFEVLGVGIAMDAPSVNDFSEGMILKEILKLLEFNPEAILEILKDPTKISFKMAPMGAGSSNGGVDSGGEDNLRNPEGEGPEDSGAEGGYDTASSNQKNSSVPIIGGKVKTKSNQGIFRDGYDFKILNRQDIKAHAYVLNSDRSNRWPSNVKKGLLSQNSNGGQKDVRYLSDNISSQLNSNFNFWETGFNWVRSKKGEDGQYYYIIDKEVFPAMYGGLSWRIALDSDGNAFLFLENFGFRLNQATSMEYNTLVKSWLQEE